MTNVKRLINDGNAEIIEKLTQFYESGELEGVIIGVKLKDGEFITGNSGTLSYLENVGLAQSIIHGLQYLSEEEDE